MIERRDAVADDDDDDNDDPQPPDGNCDAEGESSSDKDCVNLRQCLTEVDFPDSEKETDDEQNTKEAKNISGDQGHENDSYEDQATGNESEELFSASEED